MAKAKEKTAQVKITLLRSTIGQKPDKRATVRSLGLRKIRSSVVHEATASILGMAAAVSHLVKVEEC
jgi:large subunit ribosomal protein L30